jgi:flavorubredoxin
LCLPIEEIAMQELMTYTTRRAANSATLIGNHLTVPGLGVLACNAFVIHASEPVLVDTGVVAGRESFLAALRQALDPAVLRWIWITHMDPDHIGNLADVLALAPRARVVTNFLGMAKMGLLGLPAERAYLVNPGQALDAGDRRLLALRPPVFDAPETMALFDGRTRVLYSADAFGAVLERPIAAAEDAASSLRDGLITLAPPPG